jgi:hypothetical protein
LELLEIDDEILNYYRICTKNNENISKDQASRKLTRNVLLGMPVAPRNELDRLKGNRMVFYGNLHIVTRNNKVIHLSNHHKSIHYGGWFKDEAKYIELTKKLGID